MAQSYLVVTTCRNAPSGSIKRFLSLPEAQSGQAPAGLEEEREG